MKKIIRNENGVTKVVTVNSEPSMTQKHMANETNINNIMRKYHNGQMVTHLARKQGKYADLSSIPDYQESLNTVIRAEAAFMTLPSAVRARFQNNPQELITFLQNPQNKSEAISLGLIAPAVSDSSSPSSSESLIDSVNVSPSPSSLKSKKTTHSE